MCLRSISQTVLMLSIAINKAEKVYAIVLITHNYILMSKHKQHSVMFVILCWTCVSQNLYPTL